MFCINCGVRLADTETQCPLCHTAVYHPDLPRVTARPLYPRGKRPAPNTRSKAVNGAVILLFVLPLLICFVSDLQMDGKLNWFGFVAGALILAYVIFALPLWFIKPNPIIFVPCDFAAAALYLLYIALATDGHWFMSFAFPVTGFFCALSCAVVTLLYCLRRGRLYIWGGAVMALGAFMPMMEYLLSVTFSLHFMGWSVYPLIVLLLFGGALLYLAINKTACEIMERKLFF